MDWVQFLRHLEALVPAGASRDAIARCIEDGDLLTACEIAKRTLRAHGFRNELLSEFAEKRFQPAQIHQDLVAVDSRIVATSNFDKIYDTTANSLLHNDVQVKTYTSTDVADAIRHRMRCILKVHGTIDAPDQAVITRTDYARIRNEHPNFYRALDALFLTHTFIFLGASMSDPDIRMMLEDHARRYVGTRPHYVVSPEGSTPAPIREVMEESMNLKTIIYDPAGNHAELAEGIAELKELVQYERHELTKTYNW